MKHLELTFKKKWTVTSNYKRHGITVPKGFRTDLASIPRIFWVVYPPFGDYINAAVVHDYMYHKGINKKKADLMFRKIMEEDGVGFFTRNLFYFSVKIFGCVK